MARMKKSDIPMTTTQQLSAIIKSSRDIMRKDKGPNGDLDRLPQLTWIMFLKFLDDMERNREDAAVLAGTKYAPIIEAPYRWRDWASNSFGFTGDDLIKFVRNDIAIRADGTEGPGLFAYLRNLHGQNGGDRRDVVANVFHGISNRMDNGYLLRDVLTKIDGIHFTSSEEIHTLSFLYESMLKEMRDAAGDSGEFYTPRAVVQFIVAVIDPKLGEIVLDPACGTGGFLVEAYTHLEQQCRSVDDRKILQTMSIMGGEAKSLPYLLAQMNLLLHGMEYPKIRLGNSLDLPLREIGDKDRVDIIITNPPFGGEEEAGIKTNFPVDMQTSETALLFLQLIMRKLKRNEKVGRAAVVVPTGILQGDEGVCQRVKEELLEKYYLHTIVRLPKGVFEPYTGQETSIIFFNWGGPTKRVWFYEHPLPKERQELKNPCYNKSNPLKFEEFSPLIQWWNNRVENEFAWIVDIEDIKKNHYNLDYKNPSKATSVSDVAIDILLKNIRSRSIQVQSFVTRLEVQTNITNNFPESNYKMKTLLELGIQINPETINPLASLSNKKFRYIDLSSVHKNKFFEIKELIGSEAPSRARRLVREGDVIMSTVRPYLCGHAVVPKELDGQVCSTGFSVLRCPSNLNPKYLYFMLISPQVINQYIDKMRGAHYPALKEYQVESIRIPDIPLDLQNKVIDAVDKSFTTIECEIEEIKKQCLTMNNEFDNVLSSTLYKLFNRITES